MDKDGEQIYVCKLCSKRFPCGRSLGGHMRSHRINDLRKPPKPKLKSVNNFCFDQNSNSTLQENPKKSFRFSVSNGDHKLCKFSNNIDEDSGNSSIRPNNEFEVPRKKKKRSKRGQVRYFDRIVNFSDLEIEQEQEEVALCLIMLSRDLGCENRGVCSVSESSENNFEILEVGSSVKSTKILKNKGKCSILNLKFKKLINGELESTISESDVRKESNVKNKQEKFSNVKEEDESRFEYTEAQVRLRSIKREGKQNRLNFSSERNHLNDNQPDLSQNIEMEKKNNKFECTSCNKSFYSYQALGGHRASHNKIKGCFARKIENNKNIINTRIVKINPLEGNSGTLETKTSCDSRKKKINKAHFECPICFKVFSSGQALGGHKRSHFVISANSEKIPEYRDFLDLNLPATTEEKEVESSWFKL